MAYGTNAGLSAYLAASGRALPVGADPDVVRFWGTSYVNAFEDLYRGASIGLPDSFPRDVFNPVPVGVEYAAYEAGLAWAEGIDIFGTGGTAGGQVIKEKVDVLEVGYAAPQENTGYWENNRFIWPKAYILLIPYMRRKGNFYPSALVVPQ